MKNYNYIYFLILIILSSCNFQQDEVKKHAFKDSTLINSIVKKKIIPVDSIMVYNARISKEKYSLIIETSYYNDQADFENNHIDKIVIKQLVSFLMGDSVLKKISYPVKKISVTTITDRKIEIQENNIYNISIVIGKKDWLYKISGGGVLGSQSEYYGLYSRFGKLLYYSYTSYQNLKNSHPNLPDEGYGDIDKVFIDYGIEEKEFNKPVNNVDLNF